MTRYTIRPVFRMVVIAALIAMTFVLETRLAFALNDHLAALIVMLTFGLVATVLIAPSFVGRR